MTQAPVSGLVTQITDDVKLIVAGEIELAKAELKPTAKRVGIGSGLFFGALWFAISATIVIWFVLAAGLAWAYGQTKLSVYGAIFFGMLTAFVLILVIAGVFVVFGLKSFKGIKGMKRTGATSSEAMAAVSAGLTEGSARATTELERLQAAKDQAKQAVAQRRAERAAERRARIQAVVTAVKNPLVK